MAARKPRGGGARKKSEVERNGDTVTRFDDNIVTICTIIAAGRGKSK